MSDPKIDNATPTVADRSEEFVAIQGGQETSSAEGLLTAAYILMWVAVFGFIWLSSRRLQNLGSRVEELEGVLKKLDQQPVKASSERGGFDGDP